MRRPALIFAAVALVVGLWHLHTPDVSMWQALPNWDVGGLSIVLTAEYTAAMFALGASWEIARLRRAGLWASTTARPVWAVLAWRLWPLLTVSLLLPVAGVITLVRPLGVPSASSVVVSLTLMPLLFGHAAWGVVAGRWLPRVFAAPLAWGVSQALMFASISYGGTWKWRLAHLIGLHGWPLGPEYRLVPLALTPPGVIGVGLCVALPLVAHFQQTVRRALLGALCVAVAVVLAVVLVLPYPMSVPARLRTANELRCEGVAPSVCLFPESERYRATVMATFDEVRVIADRYGIDLPPVATELGGQRWSFAVHPRLGSREAVLSAFGYLLNFPEPACASTEPFYGQDAIAPMAAWVRLTLGYHAAEVESAQGRDALAVATAKRSLPPAAQGAWFNENMRRVRLCNVHPLR